MTESEMELATLVLVAVSSLASLAAVIMSWRQVSTGVATNRGQLYLEFSGRYNAPEMNDAMTALIDWSRKHGDDFARKFREKFLARDPEGMAINIHRRNLNRYFLDVAKAVETRILDRRFAKLALDHPGARIWVQICSPMTNELYGKPRSNHMGTLKKVIPSFGQEPIV